MLRGENVAGAKDGRGALLGRTAAQNKTVAKIIKKTANLKNEQYRIVDQDGNIVLEKRGKQHEVGATVGEKREHLPGNLSIHNHPAGGTFSADDLNEFGFGAKEMVAVAPEGTYRLIRTSKTTPEWVKLRDRIEAIPEASFVTLRKQARENTANSKTQKALDAYGKRFEEIRNRDGIEAARRYAVSTKEQYDRLAAQRKSEIDAEARRLETKPYDDIYRRYASEYGLRYVFEPKRRR